MKNTFGQSVTLTLFGESHGPAVGAVLDGLAPGLPVDEECIAPPAGPPPSRDGDGHPAAASRIDYQILSGVFQGRTTGTPLAIVIPNENTRSGDYAYGLARPSHADYAAYCKYHGFEDWRGGGHFSGRVTAPLVAAGAHSAARCCAPPALRSAHTFSAAAKCGTVPFADAAADIAALGEAAFPALDPAAGEAMQPRDSRRAETRTTASAASRRPPSCGLPAGVGEPWFDSVESVLSHAVFSVGGVKGIEFGGGFSAACGSAARRSTTPCACRTGGSSPRPTTTAASTAASPTACLWCSSCAVKPTPSIATAPADGGLPAQCGTRS